MPPVLEPVLSDPGVIKAMVGVVIAALTLIGGLLAWGAKRLSVMQEKVSETQEKVESTNQQVTNHHDTNLRDDLSETSSEVSKVSAEVSETRADVAEMKDIVLNGFKRMDHQFGEMHDRVDRLDKDRQALSDRVDEDRKIMLKFHTNGEG